MATVDFTVARDQDVAGIRRRVVGQYTGPASYTTGGESLTAGDLGIGKIEFLSISLLFRTSGVVRFPVYDYVNSKLLVFDDTGAEVANATALNNFTCRFEAVGY